MLGMRRLTATRELLDGDLADAAVLDGNLRDLARVNRRFGGVDLSLRAIRSLVEDAERRGMAVDELRVLDVGTGAADIPTALVRSPGPWSSAHVTAVDSRQEILDSARRVTTALAGLRDVELAIADGRSLPFAVGAFHVAHASLVLHHLDEDDAAAFLRELSRVASIGVVINDLERGRLNWLGAWLVLHGLTRNRFTLHDGPLSVRRAYTRREVRPLLEAASLRPVAWHSGFAGHRWAVAAAPV
jgi:ubiquinone/menaquinone biosynthesis C-methylase UbiE